MGGAARRVACAHAAEPETSNLQRLSIYGVSSGMASRNFRAHRAGLDDLPVILLHELSFSAAPARTEGAAGNTGGCDTPANGHGDKI
jgi:hypothetical protein